MTYPQQPPLPQQPPPPPPYYGPPPPAPKKTKKWPWVVGIVVAFFVIVAVANGGKSPSSTPAASTPGASAPAAAAPAENVAPAEQPAATVKTVVYEVTGTGTAGNITYTTDGMTSTEQVSDVPLPWSKTIELPADKALQIVQVLAQNGGSGEITATITVDGKVVKTGKSSGAYAIVSVNESIGTLGK